MQTRRILWFATNVQSFSEWIKRVNIYLSTNTSLIWQNRKKLFDNVNMEDEADRIAVVELAYIFYINPIQDEVW